MPQEEIVTQIRTLVDQQLESLRGKLPPLEAIDYARRNQKIRELLDQLVEKEWWAEVT